MKHIVSFSGGKDSTAMLLMMIEKGMRIDEVIFVDTTKEFPEMYKHIDLVEKRTGLKITRLKFDFDYYFYKHIKTKGKAIGQKGYGWPDFRNRWCTAKKRDLIKRHLKGLPSIIYQGIAFDEQHRVKDTKNVDYPLIKWKMEEKDCLKYGYDKGFTWSGLYKYFDRVSCYLCPLQCMNDLRALYTKHKDLWDNMRSLDKFSKRRFRPDYSLEELEAKFDKEA